MKSERGVAASSAPARRPVHVQSHPRAVATMELPGEGRADPDQPFEEGVNDAIDPDLRHRLVSEAAYSLYSKRGYVDGFELDDWLAAESDVDHLLLNPQFALARRAQTSSA
jgi:hypothetical protein